MQSPVGMLEWGRQSVCFQNTALPFFAFLRLYYTYLVHTFIILQAKKAIVHVTNSPCEAITLAVGRANHEPAVAMEGEYS